MSDAHLWEPSHPYYCAEGNFYKTGCHNLCESWQEFYELVRDWDPDLNLLFRWDWHQPGYDDWEGSPLLETFWVGQRKALQYSYECPVTPEDEPEVRAWLEEHAKTIAAIWAPIILGITREAADGS
jgi:hypothetical protein